MRILLFMVAFVAYTQQSPSNPDLSTPEKTIRFFLSSFYNAELKKASACIFGYQADPRLDALERDLKSSKRTLSNQPQILSVTAEETGESAKAVVKITGPASGSPPIEETLNLKKVNGNWQIVPLSQAEMLELFSKIKDEKDAKVPMITVLASSYTNLAVMMNAREKAREVSCISNVKQISLGAMMFVQDYDEKFALKADSYKSKLMPYIKNGAVFRCPGDLSGNPSYSFNGYLQGLTLARVNSPAKTVMIYEGHNRVLDFRHSGKAIVGFVDGHVKAVTAAEAKSLRWKP